MINKIAKEKYGWRQERFSREKIKKWLLKISCWTKVIIKTPGGGSWLLPGSVGGICFWIMRVFKGKSLNEGLEIIFWNSLFFFFLVLNQQMSSLSTSGATFIFFLTLNMWLFHFKRTVRNSLLCHSNGSVPFPNDKTWFLSYQALFDLTPGHFSDL